MKSTYNDPQVKLNTNRRGKTDYDIVVYGTRSLRKQLDDTVAAAIRRYMEEKEIGTRKLSRLTGIPKGTISRYRNGTAKEPLNKSLEQSASKAISGNFSY